MILVFETNWTGTVHAPGNAATIQAIARGCPGQAIRVIADASHIAELRQDAALAAMPGLSYRPAPFYDLYAGRPGIASRRRFRHEFATIRAALAEVPAGEPCLLMLISTTSTGIFAARLAARLRRRTYVQIGLHGDLNDITAPRSRDPSRRALDMHAAMHRRWGPGLRFLVLEPAIRDELAAIAPEAAARTDVLPLPINAAEATDEAPRPLAPPIRIGFVGQATEAKGIGIFLDVAKAMKARHGARVEFHIVGRAYPGAAMPDFSPIAHPVATDYLSRAEFIRRLAALHYVFLPFQGGYYRLAASGALIDAITWLKPVIAGRVPIVTQWFDAFGDIGHACDDAAAMAAVIEAIVAAPDAERYARQVAALRRARASRTPEALGETYAAITRAHFPALLGGP